jgi:four helix bundle protein
MSLKSFRSYQLAVQFHRECQKVRCSAYLRDQLYRASASVALTLAEGSGKLSAAEQRRFYSMSLGSLRECQSALDLIGGCTELETLADQLGGHLYRLCFRKG